MAQIELWDPRYGPNRAICVVPGSSWTHDPSLISVQFLLGMWYNLRLRARVRVISDTGPKTGSYEGPVSRVPPVTVGR